MSSERNLLRTLDSTIQSALDTAAVDTAAVGTAGLTYEKKSTGNYVVNLPGIKKLRTVCSLSVQDHALVVEAFVCRRPDESQEQVYRFLLRRNAKLYGVHYTVDAAGDIYLIGRLGFDAVTSAELDRVFGQVLEAADGDFNRLLEIGFLSSIRREWAWRVSRGESLANLHAFEHLVASPEDSRS